MMYSLFHRVWRCLPREARRDVFARVTTLLSPRPDRVAPVGGPVAVAGLFSTATGLGQGARLCVQALDALGHDPAVFDLSIAFDRTDLPTGGEPLPGRAMVPGEGGSVIVHINGPHIAFALWHLGRRRLAGRRIVGYWAWELPRLAPDWSRGFRAVHEVWVPSRFTAEAVSAAAPSLPVSIVPHPLPAPAPARMDRAAFGLPADAFVVVCFFHMGSSFTRKNPLAAVRAFRQAFGDDPTRVLVVKVSDPNLAPDARKQLETAVAGAGNIRVLTETLPQDAVQALLAASDAVLSLHRAEGFGLVPAEAMQLGKAVVATGWSGNMDFMTADNSVPVGYRLIPADDPQGTYDIPGQVWADPDVDEAAAALHRLAADTGLRARLGATARADAARLFGLAAYERAIAGTVAPVAGHSPTLALCETSP